MKPFPVFLTLGLAVSLAVLPTGAVEDFDAETKAALEAARKTAEKAGVKMPDIKKLMEETDEPSTPEKKKSGKDKASAAKASTEKSEPLKALPVWVTPIPGFQPAPGGKKWREDGAEKGEISGTVPGAPREVAESWAKAAKEKFRGVTTNTMTINGALTLTVFASYLKDEEVEHEVEFELKPGKGGKTSEVTVNYTIAAPKNP